jgi:hypothetical protein
MDILSAAVGNGGVSDNILNLSSVQSLGQSTEVTGGKTAQTGEVKGDGSKTIKIIGTESIFNPFYIFRYSEFGAGTTANTSGDYDLKRHNLSYEGSNALLGRVQEAAEKLKRQQAVVVQNPTAIAIKTWADQQATLGSNHKGPLYPYPYSLTDFTHCKYYGLVPNNRLLTLRRYPVPVEDNLQVHQDKLPLVPIAQAVTWWGGDTSNTLDGILGMTFGFKWKAYPKEGEEIQDVQGNELILEDALDAAGITNPTARQALIASFANMNDQNPFAVSGYDKVLQDNSVKQQESGAYANRILGPINVITETKIRDRGFSFEQKIELVFEYKLRAIGTVNPKVAMLDLLSNFLSLTYNRASFWGGGYRYFQRTGALLPGFNTDNMEKGDYASATKDITSMLTQMIAAGGDDLKGFINGVSNDAKNASSFTEGFKKIAGDIAGSKVGQNLIASRIGKLHQAPLIMRALADGRAVGEWHLTVGNPMDPIAVIGNLCMDSTTISFGEELGAHDFPINVKFKVSLSHGRPRAKQDIESMFNHGGGDLSFTALQPPASAQNSYGEYNSRRIADTTGSVSASFNSATTTADTAVGDNGLTSGQNLANYFRPAVERKYGAGFGKSGILPDYFTKLYTKD